MQDFIETVCFSPHTLTTSLLNSRTRHLFFPTASFACSKAMQTLTHYTRTTLISPTHLIFMPLFTKSKSHLHQKI